MAINNRPETASFIDPFWLEHGGQIRAFRDILQKPKTKIGEEKLNNASFNPVVVVYPRLLPIIGSVIALTEFDEIGKYGGKDYFSNSNNQRVAIRAISLKIEESLNSPYPNEERKSIYYHPYFENTIKRLRLFENQIKAGGNPPSFINSLALIIGQETISLKGVEGFRIKMEEIRREIKRYLPRLARIDQGKTFCEIRSQVEKALVDQPQATDFSK